MLGSWTSVLALSATLLLLLGVKRWISARLQELSIRLTGDSDVALVLYFVVVLPGVVIHELSHWLMAVVLGVRVQKFTLWPARKGRSSRVSLGSIRLGKVDPLRASLVGMAPLLGGSAATLLIGYLVLGVGDLAGMIFESGLGNGLSDWLRQVVKVEDLGPWVYLVFAISNAMLPSESDMAAIRPVLTFLAITAVALLFVAGFPAIPAGVATAASALTGYLSTAFALTLAVDLVFVLFMLPLTWAVRRVQDGSGI